MTDGSKPPDAKMLAEFLGTRGYGFWTKLIQLIDTNYPTVFTPDWIFGGKKYGWGLRFKKSKSFCTLIPERGRLAVQIVFGREERHKAADLRRLFSRLSASRLSLAKAAIDIRQGGNLC